MIRAFLLWSSFTVFVLHLMNHFATFWEVFEIIIDLFVIILSNISPNITSFSLTSAGRSFRLPWPTSVTVQINRDDRRRRRSQSPCDTLCWLADPAGHAPSFSPVWWQDEQINNPADSSEPHMLCSSSPPCFCCTWRIVRSLFFPAACERSTATEAGCFISCYCWICTDQDGAEGLLSDSRLSLPQPSPVSLRIISFLVPTVPGYILGKL